MVTINLYTYTENRAKLDKTDNLTPWIFVDTQSNEINGLFYSELDTIKPLLVIRSNEYITANYVYIQNINRYYFVDSVAVDGNKFNLHLRLDVLQTFKDNIKNAVATSINRENANKYISTRQNVYNVKPITEKVKFSVETPFDEQGTIICVTIKGKQ